ncbi:MAG: GWxTD domain-containing protein [Ignavibacteriaceae bacterium]
MKKLFYLFAFLFLTVRMFPQIENTGVAVEQLYLPIFNYEIVNFPEYASKDSRLDIFIQVPFSVIKFVKASSGVFKSEYTVTIAIFDEKKEKLLTEKSWTEKVESPDYEQTVSTTSYNLSIRSFILSPASYAINLKVEDKDSRKEYSVDHKTNVNNFNSALSLSDIIFIENKHWSNDIKKIYPNVSRLISNPKAGIPFFFELNSDSVKTVNISYTILTKEEKSIYQVSEERSLVEGINRIFRRIENADFGLGDYFLRLEVTDKLKNSTLIGLKPFYNRLEGIPFVIKDLGKAVEQMVYIASSTELDSMRNAPTDEIRFRLFFEFWKRRDPNVATSENEVFNEYYRRVEHANKNFTHYTEGWRTDMGMVYIILGPPSNIDRHPFEIDSKPYEVWHYYELNRQYVFVDYTGFGDYRLVTPFYGDVNKFR